MSRIAAFTICSNNYIPKAQILSSSIKKQSDAAVYLVLADCKNSGINYNELGFDKVIIAEDLPISNLQWMKENYSIVEFNTALKSFAFEYIFSSTSCESLYYFDPDIKVYQPLAAFESFWQHSSIVLTPHVLTPVPFDNKFPGENLFLNHGTFNLGFIGLRKSEITFKFLAWWSERLTTHCVIDLREGFFVDQIWCNLVPVYYPNDVTIVRHFGWNGAYWNLHERTIERASEGFVVNSSDPLFFYHFSSFDSKLVNLSPLPEVARYSFETKPDIKDLYADYKRDMDSFRPQFYSAIRYFDSAYPLKAPPVPMHKRISKRVKREINNMFRK